MQFIKTIKASLSSYNVDVAIDSVSAGSIVVTSTTTFLDGSQAGANAFAATIGSSTAAASLFPAATYGTVTSTAKVQQVANASKFALEPACDVRCVCKANRTGFKTHTIHLFVSCR